MAYLFIRRQGSILIPRWYGVHGTFLKLLYWNWWSSILETVVSGNLSSFLKGVKPLNLYDVDRGVVMETMQGKLASSQFDFGYTEQLFHSWGDISVLLVLWQFCWGLSGVQSSKSPLLTCLIGKTQLLWTQCRGNGPHLAERGKSHWFSPVVAGTWGIFSSYCGMSIRNWSLFSEVRTPV